MEVKQITLQRITLEFRYAYNKCRRCFEETKQKDKIFAFAQRMDEILLLYSALTNVSVNEAKKRLFVISEESE